MWKAAVSFFFFINTAFFKIDLLAGRTMLQKCANGIVLSLIFAIRGIDRLIFCQVILSSGCTPLY